MATSGSAHPFLLLFLLCVTVIVETRPSPQQDNAQIVQSLFGARLSSLILAPPSSDDITEGSADHAHPYPTPLAAVRGLASGRKGAVPDFLLDFLQHQSKMGRRNRKSMVGGGRGCFGMKMDRIGTISGLGC